MLKLKIHNANQFERNVKATIQSTGKLGFSDGAIKKMKIESGKFLVIASNEADENDENFYAWLENTDENGGFKINKGGQYYNANTKPLFDELKIDYKNQDNLVIYDIVDFDNDGNPIFKFIKRVRTRNKKNKKNGWH
ncbi:hypothetical protein GWR56_09285 [Mucilaginibacter sp. 14171R-50]|uniref:hypothetical protein n=1 Tax=Mucilaginibacter sp. 14171R-50 TaxID=2703789 RepID=UPI00138D0D9D|nr:hypothetical protein [Mucilaginibacter sp. 14171R-50]QHS55716.1 hypothetical protein GWR56_09285 [Mucilaginibacter sp. 14171R-50]